MTLAVGEGLERRLYLSSDGMVKETVFRSEVPRIVTLFVGGGLTAVCVGMGGVVGRGEGVGESSGSARETCSASGWESVLASTMEPAAMAARVAEERPMTTAWNIFCWGSFFFLRRRDVRLRSVWWMKGMLGLMLLSGILTSTLFCPAGTP